MRGPHTLRLWDGRGAARRGGLPRSQCEGGHLGEQDGVRGDFGGVCGSCCEGERDGDEEDGGGEDEAEAEAGVLHLACALRGEHWECKW